jgi:peptide deformylase
MADILTLLSDKAPILKKEIAPVDVELIGESLKELSERLHATRRAYHAVGLAANQVGIKARMFVMGNAALEFTCINPEIIEASETEIAADEGCLTFPSLRLKVKRAAEVKVRYIDENLEQKEHVFKGLFARCFQHELDHLNGVTFDTKVSKLVLIMAEKKAKKKLQKATYKKK